SIVRCTSQSFRKGSTCYTFSRRNPERPHVLTSTWPARGTLQCSATDFEGSSMPTIRRSSGNVFRDAGFPAFEAAHLLIRADLMIEARRMLKKRRLTQVQAAKMLGITQPRVSDLVRGRIEIFSIDT